MRAYDIRRGHQKRLEGDGLRRLLEEVFGDVEMEGGRYLVRFGAIRKMEVGLKEGKLTVDMEMDPSVDDQAAGATIRANNAFLERATGFTAKERRSRLQKAAKDG